VLPYFFKLMALSLWSKQLPRPSFALPDKQESMAALSALLESGKLTPFIDRTYPLGEMPEAMRYLQRGDALGKVVVTMGTEA